MIIYNLRRRRTGVVDSWLAKSARSVLIIARARHRRRCHRVYAGSGVSVVILDTGGQLDTTRDAALARMSADTPNAWAEADLQLVRARPIADRRHAIPEKRSYGSDYPFREFGQRGPVSVRGGIPLSIISGAFGGFSNVWGAQVLPFTPAVFQAWPVTSSEMFSHYDAIARNVPIAGRSDDLARYFPTSAGMTPLPPLSERAQATLARYDSGRRHLHGRGVFLGHARLALDTPSCLLTGLCMTGCPYSAIYSAGHTLDALARSGRVAYHGGLAATQVSEAETYAEVHARSVQSGTVHSFRADRVLVACGALGSARLALRSLGLFDTRVPVQEAQQFLLPFASRKATPRDPRDVATFTLNQFNMFIAFDELGIDAALLHFYTFDRAFLDALPWPLHRAALATVRSQVLRRLSVAFGYLPSWSSPGFTLSVSEPAVTASWPACDWSRRGHVFHTGGCSSRYSRGSP